MALDYTIDPTRQLITVSGNYATAQEWTTLLGRLFEDPHRQPGFAILRDLRGADTPVDVPTVIQIIDVVKRIWPRLQASRAAIVTASDIDPAAVAHVLAAEQHIPLRAFTSYAAALDWLRDGT